MTHLDTEIALLKKDLLEMWHLVVNQLDQGQEALINFDRDLAMQVVENEKRVNFFELKIDRDCEDIFALFQPVATDLRFTLSTMRIANNLERIGDIAASVANFVLDADKNFEREMLERTQITTMYGIAKEMLADTLEAFDSEDTRLVRTIFKRDKMLDAIDEESLQKVADCIAAFPDQIQNALLILSMIRKLERIGDQTKNIAEDVVFYYEAKVLKHKKRKENCGILTNKKVVLCFYK
ncbi:MAG: phosphate signaling complex protein PhoU [Lewinellaceae bacterium]|nr:phosphate signaling complex protein PhoU [Lewinellaceae bacterium]